jgi:hypothetical protein
MLPFHPDRCGGLRPFGRFALRNQYLLTILGINIACLVIVTVRYLTAPASLFGLVAAAALFYVLLGPVVFAGPLLSFRGAMLRTKTELSSEVAQRLRVELQRLRRELPAGELTAEDEALIDRLRKLGGVIDELPVWPFDAMTVRNFLAAYGAPLAGAFIYPWLNKFWALLRATLGP